MHEDLEDEQKEDSKLVSLHQFGLLMIDWTDMTKLVEKVPPPRPSDRNPHADLALQLLLALYDSERSDDARKAFCQFLGHLQFFPSKEVGLELDNRTVLKLNILIENLQEVSNPTQAECSCLHAVYCSNVRSTMPLLTVLSNASKIVSKKPSGDVWRVSIPGDMWMRSLRNSMMT